MDRGHSYRRHLPHYQSANRTYLVTFVTSGRWTLPPRARDIVLSEIVNIHYDMAFVFAGVVMPDHVNLVVQPLWNRSGGPFAVFEVPKKLKGRSSRFINIALARSGAVWLDENFDHQMRSEESLIQKSDYVLQNPVRKNLAKVPEDYPWIWRWWIEGKKRTS
jgi:REP-associated tyrosine transposase